MSTAKYAPTFAPYTPPPDDPSLDASSSRPTTQRAWFPSQHVISYQSGGLPTFNTSQAGGAGATEVAEAESGVSAWETRFGMRVDILAAAAYILGPVSALLILVLETHNDYVRFHAYQSALLTGPLVLLRMLVSLLRFPQFLRTIFTFIVVVPSLYMTWQAYTGAARYGLSRFQLPIVGAIADRWVTEE
ncbi:uncharacterized protein PHACADRAFT_247354 [Phanerochaete carnosa HHB-10118-sp]|uniref:Uncharacterized protein n=1 Tax=Phanerochaete carnosa (strain HHB-10118-sp) TaxID=650164 RepID=K5WNL1_PHACS|nr:uncharacterized protein PHACADRAFT_247354 [Phanerochaete carnosa HHB-10118-sp]EKM61035.1 hypothetical protein PHACADRAFT_247354 [Phanerochaete carnosa HHB-10118-sp]